MSCCRVGLAAAAPGWSHLSDQFERTLPHLGTPSGTYPQLTHGRSCRRCAAGATSWATPAHRCPLTTSFWPWTCGPTSPWKAAALTKLR